MSAQEWIARSRQGYADGYDADDYLPRALDALEAVLAFATAERDKISRTYVTQPNTAYAGYANAMDDVIRTIETALEQP